MPPKTDQPGGAVRPESFAAAAWRGFRNRCPACGSARLFRKFLKPVPVCPACGQDWTHQRADDFPAYVVILVVGHLLAPAIIALEQAAHPPPWVQMTIWLPVATGLMIGLLQPAKGAIIAMQWWFGMHGFGDRRHDDAPDQAP